MKADWHKWIYWLDEVTKDHASLIGKKCANLGELTRAGFRVPKGFALSLHAYERFMRESGALEEVRACLASFTADPNDPAQLPLWQKISDEVRAIVESKPMPGDMVDAILRHYEEFCARTSVGDCPVATRSAGPASHPGQYETFLHVRGGHAVLTHIIRVWGSTFNPRSLVARGQVGLPLEYDPIGVAVLQMVNAKAAGVMFTLNPANGDRTKIIIEGNWGLGESVVSGSVTPDEWVVDKVVLEISRKTISVKELEYVVNAEGKVGFRDIPSERQRVPCLSENEVLELAKGGKKIEQHCGEPQDIEWVIAADMPVPESVFFVQTRPETTWKHKAGESKLLSTGDAKQDVVQFWMNVKA